MWLKSIVRIALLIFVASVYAQNVFNVPVTFDTGSTVSMTAGVPILGTWDFSTATSVVGVPPPTIAITGDGTGTGTTSIPLVLKNIPDLTTAPGSIVSTNIAAPTPPAAGLTKLYTDSTTRRFNDKDQTGKTGTTVIPKAATTNNFLTGIGTDGNDTRAQPSFTNLLGQITLAQGGVPIGTLAGQVLISGVGYIPVWRTRGPYTTTTAASIISTTTETVIAQVTIDPVSSAVQVGSWFRIVAFGTIDNGTTAITFTPRVRWGGLSGTQLIATPTIVGTTSALTNKSWRVEAYVYVLTTGATGTLNTYLKQENHTADSGGAFGSDSAQSVATVVDTTISQSLVLTWQMSATTGSPNIKINGVMVDGITK